MQGQILINPSQKQILVFISFITIKEINTGGPFVNSGFSLMIERMSLNLKSMFLSQNED